MYGHRQEFRKFVKEYSNNFLGITSHAYIKTIVTMAGIPESRRQVKFIRHGNFNENLSFFGYDLVKELFEIYKSSIEEEIKDRNELNFNLALLYKHEGAVFARNYQEKSHKLTPNTVDSLFSLANYYYSKLPDAFLNSSVEVYAQPSLNDMEKQKLKRRHLFIYPDHFKLGESFTYAGIFRYYGDDYFNYMIKNKLISKYYHSRDDYNLLITWIDSYFEMYGILVGTSYWNRAALYYPTLSQSTLISLDSIITGSNYSDLLDDDWINLKLASDYFESGDTASAFRKVNKIKFMEFNKAHDTEDIPYHNMLLIVTKQLSILGKRHMAIDFVRHFTNYKNRTLGYSKLAAFTKINGLDKESEIYMDSAWSNLNRVKYFRGNSGQLGLDYRTGLVETLTLQNNSKSKRQAREFINNMDFDAKLNGVLAGVRTLARMDKYYDAWSSVPEQANPEDRLRCIIAILYVEVQKQSKGIDDDWSGFDKDLRGWIDYTEFIQDLIDY
jgi:hypothetical protein